MTVLAATSLPAQVAHALAAEFALPDAGTTTVVVVRLLTATVLGGVLGLEREAKGRAAGRPVCTPTSWSVSARRCL